MKKILLSLVLILGISFAFPVLANDNLIRKNKNVTLKSWSDKLEVEIIETWENKSTELQKLTLYQPLPSHAKNIHLFVDKVGRSFDTLEGTLQKDKIFELAKEQQQMQILKMAKFPFSKLINSEDLEINPNTSLTVKWTWEQNLDFVSDFYLSSVFFDDGIKTENLKIKLIRDGKIFHAISPLFSRGETYDTDKNFIWTYEAQNIKLPNFTFFLSGSESPELGYKYGNEFFKLKFTQITSQDIFKEKTVILFDNSGSMYGAKWHRLTNLLSGILKNIPEKSEIKIGFFGKNISWIKEQFEPNTYENQKFWKKGVSYVTAKGASDWQYFLEKLEEFKQEDIKNIILVGDFSDFPLDIDLEKIKTLDLNFLALDFSDQSFFKFFIKFLKGKSLKLFESAYDFSEKNVFLKKLKLLSSKSQTPQSTQTTFLPKKRDIITQNSQVFASRTSFTGQSYSPFADFIPEIFGRYKVADYLKQSTKENLSEELWEALNSINQYFGLNILNAGENFKTKFQSTSQKNLWQEIWNLEDINPPISEIQKVKGQPFYGVPVLTGLGFHENGHLKITPFSEAQKKLWKRFPEIFTPYFSLSNQVRFCTKFRCLEVVENGEKTFTSDMLFYWKGHDIGHWGYEFAAPLAKENIIPISDLGKINFGKTVTRGEFIHWTRQFKQENKITNRNHKIVKLPEEAFQDEDVFIDLPKDTAVARSILWMKNKGVIQGYMDKTVRPNQALTRAEAVKIILALDGFKPTITEDGNSQSLPEGEKSKGKNIFSDTNGWEAPWVNEAYNRKIIKGYKDKTFKPFNKLNYAEAFKLITQS